MRVVTEPDRYVVTAETGGHPRCPQVAVVVHVGTFATADVSCDTGLR
jgi:hypothetical protein